MKIVFFGDSITDMSRVRNSDGKVESYGDMRYERNIKSIWFYQ